MSDIGNEPNWGFHEYRTSLEISAAAKLAQVSTPNKYPFNRDWRAQRMDSLYRDDEPRWRMRSPQLGRPGPGWENPVQTLFPDGLLTCSCLGFGEHGWCEHLDAINTASQLPTMQQYIPEGDELDGSYGFSAWVPVFQRDPQDKLLTVWAEVWVGSRSGNPNFLECVFWDKNQTPESKHSLGLVTFNDRMPAVALLLRSFLTQKKKDLWCLGEKHLIGKRYETTSGGDLGTIESEILLPGRPRTETLLDRLFMLLDRLCMECYMEKTFRNYDQAF